MIIEELKKEIQMLKQGKKEEAIEEEDAAYKFFTFMPFDRAKFDRGGYFTINNWFLLGSMGDCD